MFLKNVVLHEIYSKKSQLPNTFGTSLYLIALVTDITTFLYMYKVSSSDNKSVSHWLMFDYFFHV